jgi:hypothetical protein
LVAAIAKTLGDEVDSSVLEAVFTDAILRLRHAALTASIEQLTARARQGLSPQERQRLAALLAQKRAADRATQGNNTLI